LPGFVWLVGGGLGLWSVFSGDLILPVLLISVLLVSAGGLTLMGKVPGIWIGLGLSYVILVKIIFINPINSSSGWIGLLFAASVYQGHRLLSLRKKMG